MTSENVAPEPAEPTDAPTDVPVDSADSVEAAPPSTAASAIERARSALAKARAAAVASDDGGIITGAASSLPPSIPPRLSAPEQTMITNAPSADDGGAAAPSSTAGEARPKPASTGPRRVRLAVSRVNPWSVAKLSFLLSFAVGIIMVVATTVFWLVVDGLQIFTTIQGFVNDVFGAASDINIAQFFEPGRVIAMSALLSVANIIIWTALATIMALLYNITAALVGGLHLTLTDD